jgi:hypothetical protein
LPTSGHPVTPPHIVFLPPLFFREVLPESKLGSMIKQLMEEARESEATDAEAAFLTNLHEHIQRVGFSDGLVPILRISVSAEKNASGQLIYSENCGTVENH